MNRSDDNSRAEQEIFIRQIARGFQSIQKFKAKAPCILDGELVILNEGKPDFFELQRRSLMANPVKIGLAAQKLPVCYTAFDILYLDGRQVTDLPLMERKVLLAETVNESSFHTDCTDCLYQRPVCMSHMVCSAAA